MVLGVLPGSLLQMSLEVSRRFHRYLELVHSCACVPFGGRLGMLFLLVNLLHLLFLCDIVVMNLLLLVAIVFGKCI